jgi:hypothetical protein
MGSRPEELMLVSDLRLCVPKTAARHLMIRSLSGGRGSMIGYLVRFRFPHERPPLT